MSEEIVACTGCGKKFRIPDGAAPSGQFDCTACGKPVRYGAAATAAGRGGDSSGGRNKKGGSRGARRARGRQAAAAGRRGAAPAAAAAEETGRGGRRAAAAQPKSSNTGPILLAIGGGVLVILLIVLAIGNKKNPQSADVATNKPTTQMHSGTLTADPNATAPDTTSPAPDTTPTPAAGTSAGTDPAPTKPSEEPAVGGDSGIGGVDSPEDSDSGRKGVSHYWYKSDEELFVRHESVEGMTDAERAEIDELVKVAADRDSAIDGTRAYAKVVDLGKKAIPSLLSTLEGQTWESLKEQYSCYQVQLALREIVKADLPRNKDLIARYNPASPVPASNFKTAAKMWICHWLGHLRYQDQFKQFEDTEE